MILILGYSIHHGFILSHQGMASLPSGNIRFERFFCVSSLQRLLFYTVNTFMEVLSSVVVETAAVTTPPHRRSSIRRQGKKAKTAAVDPET